MRSWGAIQCIIDVNVLRRTREIFIDLKDFHVFCFLLVFFSGWLALFRWLGINTLHYFGERHWSAYLIALLTMMAVIIVWLNPRCFLSLLFFLKKNEVHIESQKGAGLYLIILLSRHLNGCALFFVNVKEE